MFVAPFAAEKHNASPIQSAYLVSIMAATELVGRLPWGILADKPGMNRHFLLSLDCLGMGVAFFAIPFLPNYTTIACLYGFSGFFQGLFNFEGIFQISYFTNFFGELFLTLLFHIQSGERIRNTNFLRKIPVVP